MIACKHQASPVASGVRTIGVSKLAITVCPEPTLYVASVRLRGKAQLVFGAGALYWSSLRNRAWLPKKLLNVTSVSTTVAVVGPRAFVPDPEPISRSTLKGCGGNVDSSKGATVIDRIEDEPVRFFLRHRAQIEAWAALESETKQLAHRALTTVGDRLAEDPPAGAEILAGDDGGYDARRLYRPEWLDDDGRPIAAVGIVWNPTKVDFTSSHCWIGVWRGQRDQPDPFVDLLQSSLTEPVAALELKNTGWKQWPLYKAAPAPSGDFWDNLRPWLEVLDEQVRTVWARTADEIERILHGRSSQSA